MPPLYPLKFQPVFKRYIWGGRRLGTVLGKPIGPGDDYAESWEIADHDSGQSVVAHGPLAGTTLHDLVAKRGSELLGRHAPQPRFPLIFKYLDCNRDLSVQVHPDDAAAAQLQPPDLGKTEAWLVLAAEPGSRIYAGLKIGFNRFTLEREVLKGRTELCLNWFEAAPGQCYLIPAGTVHALGAGVLVAEIQQASDTTYRLFDWDRVGQGGQPRKLHVVEALDAINYTASIVAPQSPRPTAQEHIQTLAACEKFVLDQWELTQTESLNNDNRCHILSVLEGEVLVGTAPNEVELHRRPSSTTCDEISLLSLLPGQTILVPASLGVIYLAPRSKAKLIDMYLP